MQLTASVFIHAIGLSLVSYALGGTYDNSSYMLAILGLFAGVGLIFLAAVIALTKSAPKGGADLSEVQEMQRETPGETVQRDITSSYLTADRIAFHPSGHPLGPYDPRINEKFEPQEKRYD